MHGLPSFKGSGQSGGRIIHQASDSNLMHEEGLEPTHLAVPEPKSAALVANGCEPRRSAPLRKDDHVRWGPHEVIPELAELGPSNQTADQATVGG